MKNVLFSRVSALRKERHAALFQTFDNFIKGDTQAVHPNTFREEDGEDIGKIGDDRGEISCRAAA